MHEEHLSIEKAYKKQSNFGKSTKKFEKRMFFK